MCTRFLESEFCNICARYISPKNRLDITEDLQEIYLDIYGFELNLDYAPTVVCKKCKDSLYGYVLGTVDHLRVKIPARWGECKPDHSNCFYHLVKVNIEKCKTIFPTQASFFPPKFNYQF